MAEVEKAVRSAIVFLCVVGSLASRNSIYQSSAKMQKLPDLYWNTSNPIFRIDNTDHIIDVNKGIQGHEYDQITIVCPYYPEGTPQEEIEKYIIYNVDREEFETCRITTAQPRKVAFCTDPHSFSVFTISFRSFSPMPNTLEYRPGHDYYFISTSSQGDLHRMVHGSCRNNNMRVVFKVANNTKPPKTAGSDLTSAVKEDEELVNVNLVDEFTTTDISVNKYFFTSGDKNDKKSRRKHREKHKKKVRNWKHTDKLGVELLGRDASQNDIALNDNPTTVNKEKPVVKKSNLIKQEASTGLTGGSPRCFVSYLMFFIVVLANKLGVKV